MRRSVRFVLVSVVIVAALVGVAIWRHAPQHTTEGKVSPKPPGEVSVPTKKQAEAPAISTANTDVPDKKSPARDVLGPPAISQAPLLPEPGRDAAKARATVKRQKVAKQSAPQPVVLPGAGTPIPPFVPPTSQQMRDQPASVTAAQVLSQRLNLSDPAVKEEVVRVLKESAEMRRAAAWEKAKAMGLPTTGTNANGAAYVLHDFVNDEPVYKSSNNIEAAISTNTAAVRNTAPYNVDGSGMTMRMWEVGGIPRITHDEFRMSPTAPGSRVMIRDSASTMTRHATHVAGTLIARGSNPGLLGMAPAAMLHAYDEGNDYAEMTSAAFEPSSQSMMISNHSYGIDNGWKIDDDGNFVWWGRFTDDGTDLGDEAEGFGRYGSEPAALDGFAHNAPHALTVFSAGNSGADGPPAEGGPWYLKNVFGARTYHAGRDPQGDGQYMEGYATLNEQSVAKNILTVGAWYDAVNGAGARDVDPTRLPLNWSSTGPTDDGRIKPDVLGNGLGVHSAGDASDSDHRFIDGTSMAAPNVSGSALLLAQLAQQRMPGQMKACTLKGLIIHTADELNTPGPDYSTGWGLMNTKAAADVIMKHSTNEDDVSIENATLLGGEDNDSEFYFDGKKTLRVTLCWTDPPGAATSGHDDHTRKLVNDLNLTVTDKNGDVHRPWVMPWVGNWTNFKLGAGATTGVNHEDNVEQVVLHPASLVPGYYTINVGHDGTLDEGLQAYALIVTGASAPPQIAVESSLAPEAPLGDEMSTMDFGVVEDGQPKTAVVTITNPSEPTLEILGVSIDGASAARFTRSTLAIEETTLEKDESATFTVTFTPPPGSTPGTFEAILHIANTDPEHELFDIRLVGAVPIAKVETEWHLGGVPLLLGSDLKHTVIDGEGNVIIGRTVVGYPTEQAVSIQVVKHAVGTGQVLWEKFLTASNLKALRTDRDGNVCIAANFSHQIYLAKCAAADGALLWQKPRPAMSSIQSSNVVDMKLDGEGNFIVIGDCEINQSSTFAGKYAAADGAVRWEHAPAQIPYWQEWLVPAVGFDGDNNIIVVGSGLLGDQITGSYSAIRTVKLAAATGLALWQRDIIPAGTGDPFPYGDSVSVNAAGDIAIHGTYSLQLFHHERNYVARLAGSDGHIVWFHQDNNIVPNFSLGARYSAVKDLVHMDAQGNVTTLYGDVTGLENARVFFALRRFDSTGAILWTKETEFDQFVARSSIKAVGYDENNNPIVMGQRDYPFEWIAAKYRASDGELFWRASYTADHPNMTHQTLEAMAVGPGRHVAMVGYAVGGISANSNHTVVFVENQPPVVAANGAVTVNEGQTANASGTFSDINGKKTVSLTTTRNGQPYGELTPDFAAGTWAWSHNTKDGPDDGGVIVIMADDALSDPVTTSFQFTVSNVLPVFEAGSSVTLTLAQASSFNREISFIDPGRDVWTAMVNYGDGSGSQAVGVNQVTKKLMLSHAYTAPGFYSVSVIINDGDAGGATGDSFVVTVGNPPRSLENWRQLHFDTDENIGDAANDADPDGDGLKNLVEFAFDTNPRQSGGNSLPQPSFSSGGSGASSANSTAPSASSSGLDFGYSFTEPTGTSGITYGAQYSTDLETWQSIADTGSGATHTFMVPTASHAEIFMRLTVTAQ